MVKSKFLLGDMPLSPMIFPCNSPIRWSNIIVVAAGVTKPSSDIFHHQGLRSLQFAKFTNVARLENGFHGL